MLPTAQKLHVLVRHSNAAKDIALADELLAHLRPLGPLAGVDVWSEDRLRPGDDWRKEIHRAIDQADVALLLLSADFLSADHILNDEVPQLLERHRQGKLRIIPVLLRSCVWEVHPWIRDLKPLSKSGKAIGMFSGDARDEVLTELAKDIVDLAIPTLRADALSDGAIIATEAANTRIDFVILTAIKVEREAICAVLGLGKDHRVKRGGRWYWRGQLPLADGSCYHIVVAQPAEMGQVEATALTKDVLHEWKPAAALLVGIAATADPDKAKLGDVVVGKSIWYYEHGKITPKKTKPQPEMMPADAALLQHFTGMAEWDGKVAIERPDGTGTKSKVYEGVIASGEKVVADAMVRNEIAAGHRKIIAIAMEDYGFSRAIWQSPERVQHLVIRGICDEGSKEKSDDWHAYAAAAAATLTKHFLLDRPLDPRNASTRPRP